MITKYDKLCAICNRPATHIHHLVEGNGKRDLSDRYGMTIPLCADCHNMTKNSVHLNTKMNAMSHIIGQLWYERQYIAEKAELPFEDLGEEARESFLKTFGKSYL